MSEIDQLSQQALLGHRQGRNRPTHSKRCVSHYSASTAASQAQLKALGTLPAEQRKQAGETINRPATPSAKRLPHASPNCMQPPSRNGWPLKPSM
jgi:hypothetical protein